MLTDPQAQASAGRSAPPRLFRLVDRHGAPHPVLDDLYESLDAAWEDARAWWRLDGAHGQRPIEIGVEVSTACGSWRTLRHAGSEPAQPV